MTRVLFVCVKNGGKSQMAAGLFRQAVAQGPDHDRWQVESAGTTAGTRLNGLSVASLAEVGVDVGDQQPRQLTPEIQQAADVVVTVGEADVAPLPGPAYESWEIDEPSLRGIDGTERMRLIRDDITRHVEDLRQRLTTAQQPEDLTMGSRSAPAATPFRLLGVPAASGEPAPSDAGHRDP